MMPVGRRPGTALATRAGAPHVADFPGSLLSLPTSVMTLLPDPSEQHPPRPFEAPAPSPVPLDATSPLVVERWAWTLVWLGVLTGGINLWGFWWSSPLTVVLAALLVLGGIAGMAASWLSGSPRAPGLQRMAMAGVLACAALPQAIIIHTSTFYSTDSAAFDDVSTRALLHGMNPYTTSMSAAARLLTVPDRFWTYTVSGAHVARASYPAGSFLVDAPAMALGLHHHVVDWVDLVAWLVSGVLMFAFLPASLRWLAALVTLTPYFIGVFGNSGTDAAFLPFLLVAVWRWDRFGAGPDAGRWRWIAPVALGLACSIKQVPWFCVPFLVVGVALEARRRGTSPVPVAARYLACVIAVFVAVNLPFIVWQPRAWLHGTLTPLVDPLVADGQGLVALALHGVTGGVNLTLLTAASATAYVGGLVAFVLFDPALKRVWPLLLPVAFFFSARSLSSYLVDLFPVVVVAAASVSTATVAPTATGPPPGRVGSTRLVPARAPAPGGVPRARVVVMGSLAAVVIALSVLAFTSAPLQLTVVAKTTSHRGRTVDTVTVALLNRTGSALTPHFLVNTGDNPNGFWSPSDGRAVVLGPHRSATVTLHPPVHTISPQNGARWLVEAYTSSPRALSTSPPVVWQHG
jgi:hypothetical protein